MSPTIIKASFIADEISLTNEGRTVYAIKAGIAGSLGKRNESKVVRSLSKVALDSASVTTSAHAP